MDRLSARGVITSDVVRTVLTVWRTQITIQQNEKKKQSLNEAILNRDEMMSVGGVM